MSTVKFIKDWKDCHKKGSVRDVTAHFAEVLIESGFAKAVERPPRHKMVEQPEKAKEINIK